MSRAKRAKESQIFKKILLIIVLLIVITGMIIGLEPDIQKSIASIMQTNVGSYDASDFVRETFTKDDTKYVPIKFKNTEETLSKEDVERDFQKAGITVRGFSSDKMATGTKVETNYGTYTLLIYGDVNGDGKVNILDAQAIIKHIVNGGGNTLTGAKKIAANVEKENEDEINVLDSARIIRFIVNRENIINSLPTSDIKNDHEKPVIKLNGSEEVTINVSTKDRPVEYKDEGVTVEDNVDHTVNNRVVVTSNVNIEKPGNYIIRYNATDSNGNQAEEVIRKVKVENYITGIRIDTLPTKVDFAKGEEIKLDGMKVTAIMAYDDGDIIEVPLDEIEVIPDIATTDKTELDRQKVEIDYKGFKAEFDITVTPHVPIFEISGDFLEKVGLGDTYIAPNVTAKDDETSEPLEVKITISSTAPDGTVVNLGECSPQDISRLINTSTIGTKYTIKYTAVNKHGNPNTLTKTVTVVDVIERVGFEADSNMEKKDYLHGDTIELKGISAVINWKSGNITRADYTKLIAYSGDSEEANIAKYDKQTITIKYKTKNAVTDEDEEYTIGTLQINVRKRLENVINEASDSSVGEIYDKILVATVSAGAGEEDITSSKIDVVIKPIADKDGNLNVTADLETEIWKEERTVSGGRKVVDVYCAISEKATFEITINPYTAKMVGYEPLTQITPAVVHLTTDITAEPTSIKLSDFKIEGVSSQPSKYKVGDELVSNVTYYHTYSNDVFRTKKVELPAIYPSDYNIELLFGIYNSTNTVKEQDLSSDKVKYELLTKDGMNAIEEDGRPTNGRVAKIRIKILEDLSTDETAGKVVRTTMEVYKKGTDPKVTKVGDQKPVTIYNEPKQTLTLGEINKDNLKLSMTSEYTLGSKDYMIKKFDDGLHYTILPIDLRDQFTSGLDITNDMLTKTVQNGGIEINHYDSSNNKTSLVKVIGIIGDGRTFVKASGNEKINYIGIAPVSTISTNAELDKLTNGKIEVLYGRTGKDRVEKHINSISIVTPPVSQIVVKGNGVKNIVCYKNTEIAEIKSQAEINRLTTGKLGIKVTGEGKSYTITQAGTHEQTNSDVGFTEVEKSGENGTIVISFWTKKPGTYTIIPYIQGKSGSDGTPIIIEASHDNTVDLIVFNSKSETDYVGSNIMNVPGGQATWFNVRFYHKYDQNNIVPIKVPAKNISYDKLTSADWTIKTVAEGTTVETARDEYAEGIQVNIGANVTIGTELEFNMTVNNTGGEDYTKKMTLIVGRAEKTTEVKVGSGRETEWMTIYQSTPAGATKMYDIDGGTLYRLSNGNMLYHDRSNTGIYYTLVSIRMNSGNTENKLVQEYINQDMSYKDQEENISFIDKTNVDELSENTIVMLGFTETNGKITIAESSDEISYVGIGISDENIAELEDSAENIDGTVVLMTVNIFYTPKGENTAKLQQTINISR